MSAGSAQSQGRRALLLGLVYAAGILFLWLFQCAPEHVRGSSAFEPEDSVMVYAAAIDTSGNDFDADSVYVVLSRNGSPFDTLGYGGVPTGMTRYAQGRYEGLVVVPSSWGEESRFDIVCLLYVWGDGYEGTIGLVDPFRISVNPYVERIAFADSARVVALAELADSARTVAFLDSARVIAQAVFVDSVASAGIVDSARVVTDLVEEIVASVGVIDTLTANAVLDIYGVVESEYWAQISSRECIDCFTGADTDNCNTYATIGDTLDCLMTFNSNPTTGIQVWALSDSVFTKTARALDYASSVDGHWEMKVPKLGGPQTVWIHSYYNRQWATPIRVDIP